MSAPCTACGVAPDDDLVLLTTKQVAQILNFETQQGVRDAIRRHDLPGIRRGRRWLIRRSALIEVLEYAEERGVSLGAAMVALKRRRRDARRARG